ncbi:MAG: hypothetical protein RQ751_08840 [Longimicrobiales bacterium]|nr:hypothetical protein [Longimicrobiales bacterium]
MTAPRYSEEEFARILRKATELQSRALVRPDSAVGEAGMTLSEMQQIAAEVGIDPALMQRAAHAVAQERAAVDRPLADKFVLADSAPGRLTDEDKIRIVQAIRDTTQVHGEADVDPTGVEWRSPKGEPTVYSVSVHSIEGRNQVRVAVDRSVAAVLTHLPTLMGGGLLGMGVVATTSPESALVGGALLAGGLGTGLVTARTLWRITSRRVRARAADLLGSVRAALPAPAPPSHEAE